MNDIKKKAEDDAQKDVKKFYGKDIDFLIEKYVEQENLLTELGKKCERSSKSDNKVYYEYFYYNRLNSFIKTFLCNNVVREAGYEWNEKKEIWQKTKKGFFSK